jgi:pyruvate/2-oxoglutarate dehydrogenase complex dihydrolipoamide acyltransferase (E2) component
LLNPGKGLHVGQPNLDDLAGTELTFDEMQRIVRRWQNNRGAGVGILVQDLRTAEAAAAAKAEEKPPAAAAAQAQTPAEVRAERERQAEALIKAQQAEHLAAVRSLSTEELESLRAAVVAHADDTWKTKYEAADPLGGGLVSQMLRSLIFDELRKQRKGTHARPEAPSDN